MNATYSMSTIQALSTLRQAEHFQWAIVPIFGVVIYFYCIEIGKKNWNTLAAALGFYAIEWIAEIINALWLHFSGFAPLWSETGTSSYLILVGINLETTLLFLLLGLALAKVLPPTK